MNQNETNESEGQFLKNVAPLDLTRIHFVGQRTLPQVNNCTIIFSLSFTSVK